jgi:hypothetical protein
MKKKAIVYVCLAGFLLCGCQALEKKQQAGAAVELHGQYLYYSTLDSLTLGLNSEDSLRVAEQYIRQWAQDILLYNNAMSHRNEQIESMVDDYRRTLYAQAYERRLVDRRMPKAVADSTVEALYAQMPDRFKLSESIMQGMLVVVPSDAPNIAKLRKWMTQVKGEDTEEDSKILDEIEKYAYQNASGYELFTDRWKTTTEMMSHMPIERTELENKLKYKNQIEVTDSTKTFILQVISKRMRGEAMPVEYSRPQIEKIILNEREVTFLQEERERLYREAIETKKINFFD